MTPSVADIGTYVFTGEERLLLDTNIWLSVYGPDPTKRRRSATYQDAFRRMRAAGSEIFLDALILSEFINAWARLAFHQRWPDASSRKFKRFRDSGDFQPVAQEIAVSATRICRVVRRCETGFSSCDVGSLLVRYAQGRSDFNDLLVSRLCDAHGLVFVTDDADLRGSGHAILTANRRLLD